MNLRTEVAAGKQERMISYKTPVMFIGSCFAGEMANKMQEGLLPVICNPFGTQFNPASVAASLRCLIQGRIYTPDDLWNHNGRWLSFDHYTEFSSEDNEICLGKINGSILKASDFLKKAGFLFVTFGTAWVYRRKDTGEIVSNCHKIPDSFFSRELLSPEKVASDWSDLLDSLLQFNPGLRIIFTVSPVRHWKDGAYGNQVSKSVLFLAIDKLLNHPVQPGYFPSYELLMDDLRDYRYYAADMLHPSETAVSYIWEKFSMSFLDPPTEQLSREITAVSRAARHRIVSESTGEIRSFAETMLRKIERIEKNNRGIDMTLLRDYFGNLQK
ncbi:MAG: GSCFA domain-containing protein [Bacteroidetes bacterium]|nr:GSCFA domain-containing protein [Bacteroidota bacterium]